MLSKVKKILKVVKWKCDGLLSLKNELIVLSHLLSHSGKIEKKNKKEKDSTKGDTLWFIKRLKYSHYLMICSLWGTLAFELQCPLIAHFVPLNLSIVLRISYLYLKMRYNFFNQYFFMQGRGWGCVWCRPKGTSKPKEWEHW